MKLLDQPQTPALWQTLQLIANPTRFLDNCARQYGDPFVVRVLGINSPPVVFLSQPQAIKDIFALPTEKFDFKKATHVFQPLMGERSLILQEGRSHQRQRQLMLPPFHGERMQAYGDTICQITQAVTQPWAAGKTINLADFLPDITLQIILQVVFGINPGDRYQQLRVRLSSLLEDVTSPVYSSLFFFPPLQQDLGDWSPWGNFLRRRQQIDDLIYAEIAQRRQENDLTRSDILTMLMSARDDQGEQMSDAELRDQLVSLLLLGYETTAAVLAWAFYLIHSSPQVLNQLRQELATLGDKPQPEAIAHLPYLTAVCQETLRIHPIALICTPRMVKDSVQISGYEFTSGAVLVPCIYLAHRCAATYPQPEQFQPTRFLQQKFSAYEYLPFGGGSRGCIGAAFSLYEMKLVLATVLTQYELERANQYSVHPVRRGITIVPSARGMQMVVKRPLELQPTDQFQHSN